MRPVPYIGVSGFTNVAEVRTALSTTDACCSASDRKLMVGVLASSGDGHKSKYPKRYPDPSGMAELFTDDPRALNLIHYATKHADRLGKLLEEQIRLGGPHLHGFQLNVVWPEPSELEDLQGMRVVLQLSRKALEEAGNNPSAIATSLDEYEGIVTDVLIDGSGGKGLALDAKDVLRYAKYIAKAHPEIGIGIAGGLSATTLDGIRPVMAAHPFVNIDAEGRLRTDDDHLDIPGMQEYLRTAYRVLG